MTKHEIGIVGGSGFIGSSIAQHLSKTYKVKVLDIKPLRKDPEGRTEFEHCDIRNYRQVSTSLKDVELVIHAAIIQIPLINEARRLGYEVNVLGNQNVCEAINKSARARGLILLGSWHVFGERGLNGTIDEEFGFRPDKVEERARLYALCKIAQETIVRVYDELSEKIFGMIRMGTVLGEGMPKETAANSFITKGFRGEEITPYSHSLFRPMLYVNIEDVGRACEAFAKRILDNHVQNERNSLDHLVNLSWPKPITILELAHIVRDAIMKYSNGRNSPKIRIIETGIPSPFTAKESGNIQVDISKAQEFLGLRNLTSPRESIERIVKQRFIHKMENIERQEVSVEVF
jgi:nucleoside-diphosphate-sugar epimerase